MSVNFSRLTIGHYAGLALLVFIAFYLDLGIYPLSNNNEGLYAEVAREMLVSGNYIIPHLNFVPYTEKPPLLYWLISISYHLLGVNAFAARLVTTTCGALTIACVLWFGHKIERAVEGWLAAIILATSLGFIVIARIVFFDMLLTACLTFTLCFFYLWWRSDKKYYLYSAYIALALAVLCKGMVALVLVPGISILFLLICRQPARVFALLNPVCLLIFLALVLPWHIIASIKYPGFAWDYFINEQVLRFFNERLPHDYYQGPVYYYIPRILIYLFPWSLLLPLLLKRMYSTEQPTDKLAVFLGLWLLIPLLFFSLSQAKANYYMILSMPALAFLLAIKIKAVFDKKEYGVFIWLYTALTAMAVTGLGYIACKTVQDSLYYQLINLIKPCLYLFLITAIGFLSISILFYRKLLVARQLSLLAGLCAATLIILAASYKILISAPEQYNELTIVNYLKAKKNDRLVYYYKNYSKQSSFLFYWRQRLPVIAVNDPDLYYGSRTPEAKEWFINAEQFIKSAQQHFCYVVLSKDNLAGFMEITPAMQFCPVAASGKGLLLSNDPADCA